MSDRVAERPAYDAIAHLYDVDMARNMPFDDVALYARVCRASPGAVLELGCGNGRVLLDLMARGIDVTGVDSSAGMLAALREKAAVRALPSPRACRMDVRRLGFRPTFAVVLCPYSLVTYMTDETDAVRMLSEAKRVLAPGGVIVVDAFVPKPVAGWGGEFAQDYVRPFGDGMLVRSKRITALAPRINRIERRYDVFAAGGAVVERIETAEQIREFAPADVLALLDACRLRLRWLWWNYTSPTAPDDARFFTAVATAS